MTGSDDDLLRAYIDAMSAPDPTSDSVRKALLAQGYEEHRILAVMEMAPLAFGRKLLEGAVAARPDYLVLSPEGDIVSRGQLLEEPLFRVASELAAARPDLVRLIGRYSSEARAVYDAEQAGSDVRNLRLAPFMWFREGTTRRGIARMEEIVRREVGAPPMRRPWWRIW